MSTKQTWQDFKFSSAKTLFWIIGGVLVLISLEWLRVFVLLGRPRPLLIPTALVVCLCTFACTVMFAACDVQIGEGRLRFRRAFVWRSVALGSVTRVRAVSDGMVYVRADEAGRRYRLLFLAGDEVARFLEAVPRGGEQSPESLGAAPKESTRDFRYESKLIGLLCLWGFGAAAIWVGSQGFGRSQLGYYLLLAIPYRLLWWAYGFAILNAASDVQILAGQFHFRRLCLEGDSVPLTLITRVRGLWLPPSVYVRVDHAGKRYRLIFPGGLQGLSFLAGGGTEKRGWRSQPGDNVNHMSGRSGQRYERRACALQTLRLLMLSNFFVINARTRIWHTQQAQSLNPRDSALAGKQEKGGSHGHYSRRDYRGLRAAHAEIGWRAWRLVCGDGEGRSCAVFPAALGGGTGRRAGLPRSLYRPCRRGRNRALGEEMRPAPEPRSRPRAR